IRPFTSVIRVQIPPGMTSLDKWRPHRAPQSRFREFCLAAYCTYARRRRGRDFRVVERQPAISKRCVSNPLAKRPSARRSRQKKVNKSRLGGGRGPVAPPVFKIKIGQRLPIEIVRGCVGVPFAKDFDSQIWALTNPSRFMNKDKKAAKITGTGGAGKELVMGLLDRETRKARVKHVTNRKRGTLQQEVRATVKPGAEVFTDELASYTGLEKDYVHKFVNHAEKYVEGNVHTNGIEN